MTASLGVACADADRAQGVLPDSGVGPGFDAGPRADAAPNLDAGSDSDSGVLDAEAPDAAPPDAAPPDAASPDTGPSGREEVPVAGGTFQIVRDGLFGGVVLDVQRSPVLPDLVFAGTDGAGLFRSDDGGASWRPTGLSDLSVEQVRLHPTDPQVLWVMRNGPRVGVSLSSAGRVMDLVRSQDGGATFTPVALPVDMTSVTHVAVSQNAAWIAGYAPGRNVVFRSTDDGATWISTAIPSVTVQTLLAHPTDANVAWARNQEVVLRTGDGGASFVDITPTLTASDFPYNLILSPVAPERLWLGVANGTPFRSDDGGQTWQRLDSAGGRTYTFYPSSTDADVVWATDSRQGVLISEDGGATFRALPRPRELFNPVLPRFSPRDATEALAYGTVYEVQRTVDGAATWDRSVEGLSAVWVRAAAISADGGRVVVADDHGAVFVSDNQARSFTRSTAGLPALAVSAIALDPSSPDVVYVGTGSGHGSGLHRSNFAGSLYKSIDGGRTFSPLSAPRSRDYVLDIGALFVAHDGAVLVREGLSFPARSMDGGLTWTALSPTLASVFTDRRAAPSGGGSLLTGYTTGTRARFVVSSDLGSSWTEVGGGSTELELDRVEWALSSRVHPLVHYAKTRGAFARYSGSAWGRAEVGLAAVPGMLPDIHGLAVGDNNGADRVVAVGRTSVTGGSQWSLHVSTDGALSWRTTALPYMGVPTVVAAAEGTGDLFVVGLEAGRGLLVTRTGGQ